MSCGCPTVGGRPLSGGGSGGGMTWTTVLDFDWTAQANQALPIVGAPAIPQNFTTGGVGWFAVNGVGCTPVPPGVFEVQNGQGVVITPVVNGGLQWAGPSLGNLEAPGVGIRIASVVPDYSPAKYWVRCWSQYVLTTGAAAVSRGCFHWIGDIDKRANQLTNIAAGLHNAINAGPVRGWQTIGEAYGLAVGFLPGVDTVRATDDVVRVEARDETIIEYATGVHAGAWPTVQSLQRRRLPPARYVENTVAPLAYWDPAGVAFVMGLLKVALAADPVTVRILRTRIDVLDVSITV